VSGHHPGQAPDPGDPTRNLVVAVLVGAVLLVAAIALVALMVSQPPLAPVPVPTVQAT